MVASDHQAFPAVVGLQDLLFIKYIVEYGPFHDHHRNERQHHRQRMADQPEPAEELLGEMLHLPELLLHDLIPERKVQDTYTGQQEQQGAQDHCEFRPGGVSDALFKGLPEDVEEGEALPDADIRLHYHHSPAEERRSQHKHTGSKPCDPAQQKSPRLFIERERISTLLFAIHPYFSHGSPNPYVLSKNP